MKYILITILFVICYGSVNGQVFWSEDFSNGIPDDWKNEDNGGIGVFWSYCPDTTNYGDINPNCPFNYNDPPNGFQTHFKSDSPENGYATIVLRPFYNELTFSEFSTSLTTSEIDCSGKENVYVLFNSHIGLFNNDEIGNILLNASTDKTNWTSYPLFENLKIDGLTLPGFKRWSENPAKISVDISSVAANQDTVYLQWSWTANDEYHWSIDDIQLTTENPLPDLDISLSPFAPFHSIMPNYKTPISQIDTAFFLTDIGNLGKASQEDVEVVVQVIANEDGSILYEEIINIPTLRDSQKMNEVLFPPYYHTAGLGKFEVVYSTNNVMEDQNPEDNVFKYPFEVTENEFTKHRSAPQNTVNLFPDERDGNGNIETNWAIANHFYVPKGENYYLDEITFELPNRQQLNGPFVINDNGIELKVELFEWNDAADPDIASADEYVSVGQTIFTLPNGMTNGIFSIKPQDNFISGDQNIPLKDDQHYFVSIDYEGSIFKIFSVIANTSLNYDRMIDANQLIGRNRFAAMSKIGDMMDYNTFAFGGCITPQIGFTITGDATSNQVTPIMYENGIQVTPNPANTLTTIDFDFIVGTNARLNISHMDGRLIQFLELQQGQESVDINCKQLPSATYLITYKSENFISISKLTVVH